MSFLWTFLATVIFLISLSKLIFVQSLTAGTVLSLGVIVTYICYYSGIVNDPIYLQVACGIWVLGFILVGMMISRNEDNNE